MRNKLKMNSVQFKVLIRFYLPGNTESEHFNNEIIEIIEN